MDVSRRKRESKERRDKSGKKEQMPNRYEWEKRSKHVKEVWEREKDGEQKTQHKYVGRN